MKSQSILFLVALMALGHLTCTASQHVDMGDNFSTINKKIGVDMTVDQMIEECPFVIPSEIANEMMCGGNMSVEELLQKLVLAAQKYARASVSNYKVGVAALGESGNIYVGVNLEFQGMPLSATVHAEQFLVALARLHGETKLTILALSAPPCGHCRQFLNEMGVNTDFQLIIDGQPPVTFSTLLPQPFGPENLGLTGGILQPVLTDHVFTTEYSTRALALHAAYLSYAPCTGVKCGVAILTKDGRIYSGSYLETVAFNPSLSPLQVALVALVAGRYNYSDISEVLLMEQENGMISHEAVTRELLRIIAPDADFQCSKFAS